MGSKKFKLNISDLSNLGKNALLVGGAAAVTYVMQNLGELDLGDMGALVVPIIALALDTVVKWMKNNTDDKE
jgi:hypothetical protein